MRSEKYDITKNISTRKFLNARHVFQLSLK